MEKVFSAMQPTGRLHIGNYLGALRQWVALQKEYKCIFGIVDYHAITVKFPPERMKERILNTAIDYLAAGLNPKKSIIFVQSDRPEHTELAWILGCLTSIGALQRMTQFKEKSEKYKSNVNAGLFTYPVLQAADILIYKADAVPVGEDQVQHVELTRDIARKFNQKYGSIFPEPKALVSEGARILGLDGKGKMSKSNAEHTYISLSDTSEQIKEKISGATTDKGNEPKISRGSRNLIGLLEIFAGEDAAKKYWREREKGTIKYAEMKEVLAEAIIKALSPIQAKRTELERNPAEVKKILELGASKLAKPAQQTIKEVKKVIGLT